MVDEVHFSLRLNLSVSGVEFSEQDARVAFSANGIRKRYELLERTETLERSDHRPYRFGHRVRDFFRILSGSARYHRVFVERFRSDGEVAVHDRSYDHGVGRFESKSARDMLRVEQFGSENPSTVFVIRYEVLYHGVGNAGLVGVVVESHVICI